MAAMFLIVQGDDRDATPTAWRSTREAAEAYILENPPRRYSPRELFRLNDDGSVEHLEWYEWVPEPYRGPLVQARIYGGNRPGYFHRVPIDCMKPRPDAELTEGAPWRVLRTEWSESGEEPSDYFVCQCGEWQEVEGSPESIVALVAEFGERP